LPYGGPVLVVEDVKTAEDTVVSKEEGAVPVHERVDTKASVFDVTDEESVVHMTVEEHAGGGV